MLLTVIGIVNQVDRALPGILAEPIKQDLNLSDTAMGLINGFGFLIVYALVGVPIARLSDRGAYGLVISGCLAVWSAMTMLGAAAQTGIQLGLTRMGVAVGESGSTPAAHAFIARNFPPSGRAAPLAVLTLSVPLATFAAILGGSLAAQAWGWRVTFLIMAVSGLALSPIVLMMLGKRQSVPETASAPMLSFAPALLLLRNPSFLIIVCATAFIGMGGYCFSAFSSAFLMRTYNWSLGEVGVVYGVSVGLAGVIGLLVTGFAADKMAKRDARWILWVLVLMIVGILPFALTSFLTANVWIAVSCMAVTNIIGMAYQPPVIAAIQRLAPPDMRGTASALMIMFTALAGGMGPFLVGLISDALQPSLGALSLARAMLVIPAAYTVSAILFALATRRFRRDMYVEGAAGLDAAR